MLLFELIFVLVAAIASEDNRSLEKDLFSVSDFLLIILLAFEFVGFAKGGVLEREISRRENDN